MKIQSTAILGILAAASAFSTAQAGLICPGLSPVPFSRIETEIRNDQDGTIITAKHIDCKKVAVGAKVVTEIQQMLGRELPTPSSFVFRMVDEYDNAYFDSEDLSLNVPYQLVIDSYAKNPVYSVAIWAHEFGHAILDKTLQSAAPKWRAIIKRRLAPDADEKIDPAKILAQMIGGYHEFFADVIAVLYTGKGDAVSRGLYLTGFLANPEGNPTNCPNRSDPKCRPRQSQKNILAMATYRDFTDRGNQLGRWKGTGEIHGVLAPARYHIYKYYLSNPEISRMKAKLAGVTVDAIMADLNRRLMRMSAQPGGLTRANFEREMRDIQRTNDEFIETIDQTFKKSFGL